MAETEVAEERRTTEARLRSSSCARGDAARCGEVWRDAARCGEMWRDLPAVLALSAAEVAAEKEVAVACSHPSP